MKELDITLKIKEYATPDALPSPYGQLCALARDAADTAYAPYSHFQVGAALLLDDGTTVTGSNQENAAYPSGLCAERTALFYAGAQYPTKAVKALAITAITEKGMVPEPISPCGACRQVIIEAQTRGKGAIAVILYAQNRVWVIDDAQALLPLAFSDKDL